MGVQVRLDLERAHDANPAPLSDQVARELSVDPTAVHGAHLRKLALDARRKRPRPTWQLTVDADLHLEGRARESVWAHPAVRPVPEPVPELQSPAMTDRAGPVAVIGAGPAGLFAALRLAEHGARVVLIERGKPVEERARDFGKFRGRGELDPESNLCFGEGGAGTYSDGKLTCRRKDPMREHVLRRLVEFGAPAGILTDAKPHIGTNYLFRLLKEVRARLDELGVQLRFRTRLEAVKRTATGLTLRLCPGEDLDVSTAVLAMGHSARDLFERLASDGLPMEAKDFAVGVRIEHPQALIDAAQYRTPARPHTLPPADYRLAGRAGDRGVYSFCMCPGGMVVPTATEPETVVVNGMSSAKRGSPFANSGLVTQVRVSDLAREGWGTDALAGIRFQRHLERAAYRAGGADYRAPAVRADRFLRNAPAAELAATHFRPGLTPADFDTVFPPFVLDGLRQGLRIFERRIRGYASSQANLIGVESRTSSPIRIARDPESLHVPGWPGLYVAGEGPGHAGGIMSAALDGLRVGHAILVASGTRRPTQ